MTTHNLNETKNKKMLRKFSSRIEEIMGQPKFEFSQKNENKIQSIEKEIYSGTENLETI